VNDASDPVSLLDSKWIAYQVDPGAAQRARAARPAPAERPHASGRASRRLRRAAPAEAPGAPTGSGPDRPRRPAGPSSRGVELRNLETGAMRSWQDIGPSPSPRRPTQSRPPPSPAPKRPGPAGQRGGGGPRRRPERRISERSAGPRGQDGHFAGLADGDFQLFGAVGTSRLTQRGASRLHPGCRREDDGNGVFVSTRATGA